MRKTKNMLWVLSLMLMCLSCYDDTELLNRIDALEKVQTSTVNNVDEQVKAIKSSIASLTDLQNSLKNQLTVLESQYETLQVSGTEQDYRLSELEKDVMNLTNMVQQIAVMIDSLRSTVNDLLAEQKSWAEATFATLEQHNALCDVLATTKVSLEDMMKGYDEANVAKFAVLAGQIQTVETSLKAWVSDQLANYYDIATMDAKLKALEAAISEGDEALKKELAALAASADAMKQELTTAYQSAIKTAIEENNGTITKQIAKEIAAVNDRTDNAVAELNARMTALENRVDALEKQMNELTKQLDITFSETESIVYSPGTTVKVSYTLVDADENTTVEAIADAGWKAKVASTGKTEGYIEVMTSAEGGEGKVLVFVNKGNSTIMRVLRFEEGVLTVLKDIYTMVPEGGTLEITAQTNVDGYTINIPLKDQNWLRTNIVSTRTTMHDEILTFDVSPCMGSDSRSTVVDLTDNVGHELVSFVILQYSSVRKNNGHEYVDLGLGVMWATCNVGAEYPEDFGDYYAWGETEAYDGYHSYKWKEDNYYTKYCLSDESSSFSRVIDHKAKLDLEDDVAHLKWGNNWRMPTYLEMRGLYSNCTWMWVQMNGVNGYKVTSNINGNSIFLPAAKFRTEWPTVGNYKSNWLVYMTREQFKQGASASHYNRNLSYSFGKFPLIPRWNVTMAELFVPCA